MIKFTETGLNENILSAISDLGFVEPTPIQQKTISHLLNTEKDLIALAQTGTGKTAAFGLPVIQKINIEERIVQTLVLSPTRELAIQIGKDLEAYSKNIKNLGICCVYGGASIVKQTKELKSKPQIVVGTPGRVLDLIRQKILKVDQINWLILDEADEMLNMGFKDELDGILSSTPGEKQTLLFSATMPAEISRIAKEYMHEYDEITVGKKNSGSDDVTHQYYMIHARDRYLALKRIADVNPDIYGIVFCRTRQETKDVAEKLMHDGYNADALHGDLSQAQREQVMNRFRVKHLQILVATDVAARGLDVNDLSHIINYNLPDDMEIYTHRSGRTGRAGKKGISIAIIHMRELSKIRNIEQLIGKKFSKENVPGGKEICGAQLVSLINKIHDIEINDDQISGYLPKIYDQLKDFDREELIKRFVSAEFNRFLEYYKDAKDINVSVRDRSKESRGNSNFTNDEFTRFFINLGAKDKLTKRTMIKFLDQTFTTKAINIGRVDIMENFSFFEVETSFLNDVIASFKGVKFKNRKVLVEVSNKKAKGDRKGKKGKKR